jgi:hypothetical protein
MRGRVFSFHISKHGIPIVSFPRRGEDKKAGLFFKSRLYPTNPDMDPSAIFGKILLTK